MGDCAGATAPDSAPPSAWPWALALLALVLTAPLMAVEVPPVLDYPNHLAGFFILAHPDDPVLSRFYAPHWIIAPNLGADILGAGLLRVLPTHIAGRLILALAMLAPVLGCAIYSRAAFGRLQPWALASGLAAYNGLFFLGFLNFLLAMGLALAGAGLFILARRRGSGLAAFVGAGAASLVFFCHLFGVLFLAVLIGAAEVDRLWRLGRPGLKVLAGSAVVLAASLAPPLALYLVSPLAAEQGVTVYRPWPQKLMQILTPFMTYDLVLGVATAAVVGVVLRFRGARAAPGTALAFLVLGLCYVVTPGWVKGGAYVDTRFPVMAGLLLFAGLSPRLSPRAGRVAAIVVCGLIGVRSAIVAQAWLDHRPVLDQLRQVIAPVPPGAKVLTVLSDASAPGRPKLAVPGLYGAVDKHMPALLAIERRAFWPLLFADPGQQPLAVRAPFDRLANPLGLQLDAASLAHEPPTADDLGGAGYLRRWRADFDYVLVLNTAASPLAARPPATGLRRVAAQPAAALYALDR